MFTISKALILVRRQNENVIIPYSLTKIQRDYIAKSVKCSLKANGEAGSEKGKSCQADNLLSYVVASHSSISFFITYGCFNALMSSLVE